MAVIQPHLQKLYDWTLSQTDKDITMKIEFPVTFNPTSLSATISEDGNNLMVEIPDQPPIIWGRLAFAVSSAQKEILENIISITLIKAKEESWPILITKPDEQYNGIDPKSALVIYRLLSPSEKEEERKVSLQLLQYAAQVGFAPAIRELASILIADKSTFETGRELLAKAVSKYNDPISTYHLGLIYSADPKLADASFRLFQSAAAAGVKEAYISIGECYSPFSNQPFPMKDAELALQNFQKGNEGEPNAIALYEMAKLYENGAGVDKDLAMAERLRQQAIQLDPRLAEATKKQNEEKQNDEKQIEEKQQEAEAPEKPSTAAVFAIASVTLAAAAFIGFSVYRRFKK